MALSFRQCSLLASDLARSIYAERLCDERPPCAETCRGDPELQGNGRRFTAETEVPRGTVVPTVLSPGDVPCSFHLRNRSAKRGTTAQKRTPAILDYKETEEHSLPRRQCHVALSFRQCSSRRRTLLVPFTQNRSAKRDRTCAETDPGDPELQGNGKRFTAETAVPRGTVVSTVFSSWRRTLLVRFTRNRSAKRDRTAQKRTPAPLNYKETEKDSLPRRQCHVALSFRQCSSLATYLARSIYAERWCDEHPPAQKRTPAILHYKETEKDSLPRRQCHVALSFRQCSLPGVGPCSCDLRGTFCEEG